MKKRGCTIIKPYGNEYDTSKVYPDVSTAVYAHLQSASDHGHGRLEMLQAVVDNQNTVICLLTELLVRKDVISEEELQKYVLVGSGLYADECPQSRFPLSEDGSKND